VLGTTTEASFIQWVRLAKLSLEPPVSEEVKVKVKAVDLYSASSWMP